MPEPRISSQPPCLQKRQPSPPHLKQSTSTSAEGSVNGKNDGRKRRRERAPNICSAKSSQRGLEVGHRDVAIDREPLDLVEHRRVGGVGEVAAVHLARRR